MYYTVKSSFKMDSISFLNTIVKIFPIRYNHILLIPIVTSVAYKSFTMCTLFQWLVLIILPYIVISRYYVIYDHKSFTPLYLQKIQLNNIRRLRLPVGEGEDGFADAVNHLLSPTAF